MRIGISTDSPEMAIDACWSSIGVHGDGSCPELQQRLHCRNCQIYSAAAVRLLDRDLPSDHLEEWTGHFAAPILTETATTQSAFVFRIGRDWLALPTGMVMEVAEPRAIHRVPHRNAIVLGLLNVRGELLVCISLGGLLRIAPDAGHMDKLRTTASPSWRPEGAHSRLLVLRGEGRPVVCPVDETYGGVRYAERDLTPPPATIAGASYTRAVLGWKNHTVGYLDDRLIAQALERGLA